MRKLFWFLQILLLVFSFSMCKSKDIVSEEYKSEVRNPYEFNSKIDSFMHRHPLDPEYDLGATLYSLKSNYKKGLAIWDSLPKGNQGSQAIDTSFIRNGYTVESAKDYIINESQNTSLVILNEAHHNNSDRVFAESLLSGLYKNGFRLLFLETLTNGEKADSLLKQRKYPISATGYYSMNPQYGNFIRKALEIGFTIFPYESTAKPGKTSEKTRESDQSNNIKAVLDNHPNEKAFIYVGYAHNREGTMHFWGKALAELLKGKTKIDPLTISQDKFSEKSSKSLSNPLLVKLHLKKPSVLLNKNNLPYKTATDSSWTDVDVFHPFTEYIDGRPNWLFYDGKKSVQLTLKEITIDFPIMIMAYNNREEIKNEAVPLDIVELNNKEEIATLVLAKGSYVIKAINEKNNYQLIDKTIN